MSSITDPEPVLHQKSSNSPAEGDAKETSLTRKAECGFLFLKFSQLPPPFALFHQEFNLPNQIEHESVPLSTWSAKKPRKFWTYINSWRRRKYQQLIVPLQFYIVEEADVLFFFLELLDVVIKFFRMFNMVGALAPSNPSNSSFWMEDSFEMQVLLEPFSELEMEGPGENSSIYREVHPPYIIKNSNIKSLRNQIFQLATEDEGAKIDSQLILSPYCHGNYAFGWH
ncbi:Uncharacterized protein Fot_43272 [Forsythia ovata]|uniref:Maturase K n=1 Tax=Forsythia ovata TaxID=205694 RepID=A0ABD1RNJ9_9LAMI